MSPVRTKETSDLGGGKIAIGEHVLARLGPSAVVCTCVYVTVCCKYPEVRVCADSSLSLVKPDTFAMGPGKKCFATPKLLPMSFFLSQPMYLILHGSLEFFFIPMVLRTHSPSFPHSECRAEGEGAVAPRLCFPGPESSGM